MLASFAVGPGALDNTRATSPNAFDSGVGCLNDLCQAEGVFLDMRDGAWGLALERASHTAREFWAFAQGRRRLIRVAPALPSEPDNDEEWLWEAQALHPNHSCRAIIAHDGLATQYGDTPVVVSIERLNSAAWWRERSPSMEVPRSTSAYLKVLGLVLRHANLLMFIDANIDPCARNYDEFPQLLLAAGTSHSRPSVQIHRASWRRRRGENVVQPLAQWVEDFAAWGHRLARAGRRADVFLWEDVHDRYLVSDMVAINLPYGFDVGRGSAPPTTWSRLGRKDQERLQREYEPGCRLRRFVNQFSIGAE